MQRAAQLSAVYVGLRYFPVKFQSRLHNIFLALLVHYPDKVKHGHRVFQVLVDELTFLEIEGICVELENGVTCQIYFSLAMILGDNAGLNSILRFSSCSSNFFCQICRGHKSHLSKNTDEDRNLLRTRRSYENDLQINDFTLTGIRENCLFNAVPSFHVIEN